MTPDTSPDTSKEEVASAVAAAFTGEWGRVVATLIGVTGDWDLAEECAQDAFTRALQAWQRDGVPQRPGAWLTTAARNRAIDVLRRRASEAAKLREAAALAPPEPSGADLPETDGSGITDDRLFNEGYSATAGAGVVRADLCAEAIRLARLLANLMPGEPEASGLLALMLLQDSRRAARTDGDGELVTLEDQDRDQWDHAEIAEGQQVLGDALAAGRPGPYQLQAVIAACHASARNVADTDWMVISRVYGQLARIAPSPVVDLNRAVATGMADGPAAGLALLDALAASGTLAGYHLLPAARADLLRRLGRHAEAAQAYGDALALAGTGAERRYLSRRVTEATAAAAASAQTPRHPA
ncbi:MAG TPA: DUF6596 domain-containing protein [Trebonia sp.]|nr:DUF6596 domain-containing protein [Trebonia sp.]